jgi:hypothetical protein
MRLDQATFGDLWIGPDRSKIYNERARLIWNTPALYDLLFFRMVGSGIWESKQEAFEAVTGLMWRPQLLTEVEQRLAVEKMAGSTFMTAAPLSARIYDWTINHLSDAAGEVMPRALLSLMRNAALPEDDPSDSVFTGASIRAAMMTASERHLGELHDEYWWLRIALQPLAGMDVPCEPDQIYGRWIADGTVANILRRAIDLKQVTPVGFNTKPQDRPIDQGGEPYLLDSLIQIAVASRLPDGSIYFPDVMRLAMGLKRKGGVRRRKARPG